MITGTTLHWLTGLYEGEGSCGISQGMLRLQLGMTDEDVVRRFHLLAGLGSVNGPYDGGPRRKPQWRWWAINVEAYGLVTMMWPLLGTRRREQARVAVKAWLAIPVRPVISPKGIADIRRRFAAGEALQQELAAEFGV